MLCCSAPTGSLCSTAPPQLAAMPALLLRLTSCFTPAAHLPCCLGLTGMQVTMSVPGSVDFVFLSHNQKPSFSSGGILSAAAVRVNGWLGGLPARLLGRSNAASPLPTVHSEKSLRRVARLSGQELSDKVRRSEIVRPGCCCRVCPTAGLH
eukprot:351104-Chlamydomonas_euryale.AAC.6